MTNANLQKDHAEVSARVHVLVEKIVTGLKDCEKNITWCGVSELQYLSDELQNISDFVNKEGEYAK